MPVAALDGIEIAYDLVGEGQPWVLTPGGRFTKAVGGLPEMARRAGRSGQAGADLGPSELRRVFGRVPWRVGVRGSGRSARRAPSPSRSRSHGDRRGIGRRASLTPRREPQPRCHRRSRDVVDQRRHPGPAPAGELLLHAVGRRRVARRDGRGRRARAVARGAGTQPREPRALPLDGPQGIHRGDGPVDAGLLPVRQLARPRVRRTPTLPASTSRSSCSGAARPTCHTRGRPPKRSVRVCPAPSWSNRRGETTSGTSVEQRSSRRGHCSCAGRCSSRSWLTGPTGRSRPNAPERSGR